MTGVTWQTHRAVKGGKEFENRDAAGSATIYMDRALPLAPYAGVLMVTAEAVSGPGSFFSRRKVRSCCD